MFYTCRHCLLLLYSSDRFYVAYLFDRGRSKVHEDMFEDFSKFSVTWVKL